MVDEGSLFEEDELHLLTADELGDIELELTELENDLVGIEELNDYVAGNCADR